MSTASPITKKQEIPRASFLKQHMKMFSFLSFTLAQLMSTASPITKQQEILDPLT